MKHEDHQETPSLEVLAPVSSSAIESITRGEIDIQISTAKRYPRSISEFKNKALAMVSIDEQTAESCFYSRPVGKDPQTGKQKYAEGMSVRLAEIVAACYGNIRHGSFIVSQTDRQVVARGFAHDVESNVAATCEAVEATIKRDGRPYDERMRVVIAKAALAKADRDAIFKIVPRALCRVLEDTARKVAIGDAQSIERRRVAALQWAGKLGVTEARVFSALGVKGADDITGEHIKTLLGLKTALQDGDITVEEAFPHAQAEAFPVAPAAAAETPKTPRGKKRAETPAGASESPTGSKPEAPASDAPAPAEKPAASPPAESGSGELFHVEQPKEEGAADVLLRRLEKEGITEKQVVDVCKASRIPVGETLAASPSKTLAMLLKDFDSLVSQLKG